MTKDSNSISGVLVTGANGQLGCELKRLFESDSPISVGYFKNHHADRSIFYTDIAELDICNIDDVRQYIIDNKIGLIINCAAYTAVDKAEGDAEIAYRVNGDAPGILATVGAEVGALLIHISTDYVFNGKGNIPYNEEDKPSPLSVYGRTKLTGEYAIASSGCRYIIIRTSWLYSIYGDNFVKTILRLASEHETINVTFDQIGTPTNAADLASAIVIIASQVTEQKKLTGIINTIYHFSNEGVCSWYDFASEIVNYSGLKCKVLPVTSDMFPTKAQRPVFSVLNKRKIKAAFGIEIQHWRTSLQDCLITLINIKKIL
ncbi:MAG: dTDP-4-dehydrorhamnose reductase [Rikenellaceae bacterium]